jgi:phosphoglycolate phosphatase-like HAD superfamily hydrolase
MNKVEAIGFDFDGTLIVSEETKALEMVKVFNEKLGIKRGVGTAYKKLVGKSFNREQKVLFLFKKFLKRNPTKKELKDIKNHFGEHYRKSLWTCPLFQCTNVIKELKKQVKFLFLLSLEDKKEVKKLIKHCGLGSYFDEVLGGPKSKVDNLEHVIKKHKLKPRELLYIGDSKGDVVASKKKGIRVVLVKKRFRYKDLKDTLEADFVFSSLCELPHDIKKLR